MENFELNVNLTECSFSIKGTEEFIDRKSKEIVELFEKFGTRKYISNEIKKQTNSIISESSCNKCNDDAKCPQKYIDAGLFNIDGDDIYILRKVPGKNNAEKMKNIALITLYALDKPISSKSIVKNCQKISCYDPKNFSSTFKNDTSGNFIRKGSGQSWTLEATIPGMEKAEEILEEMYNAIKK